jgi:[ribosomal protein S18]-alanine N-acetyltransferase
MARTPYTFSPMTQANASEIAAWHYPGPYAVYDMTPPGAEPDLSELLDARSPHFAVSDERDKLIGFGAFGTAAEVAGDRPGPALYSPGERTLAVGLGLRPALTGRGLGLPFVLAGLDFARQRFQPEAFRMWVLAWNERAIRVYERAGFQRLGVRHIRNPVGEHDFMELWRRR